VSGFRVDPDGLVWPAEAGDAAQVTAGMSWPPAAGLAPARRAWLARVEDVQAAHTVAVSAHAAFTRAVGVLADTVQAERVAWVAYRDAASY